MIDRAISGAFGYSGNDPTTDQGGQSETTANPRTIYDRREARDRNENIDGRKTRSTHLNRSIPSVKPPDLAWGVTV